MDDFKEQFFKERFNIEGKIIILTGATGLLGAEYAKYLSNLGAKVVAVDISEEGFDKIKEQVKQENVLFVRADISKEDQVQKILNASLEKYGKVDILVNNACYNPKTPAVHGPFENFPLEEWQKLLDVNLTGIFLCSKIIGSYMAKNGGGVIVNVSSTYGLVGADQRIYGTSGINSNLAYAATKSGVLNMTRWMASYWHKNKIRVNTLTPGGVFNNQAPDFLNNYNAKTMLGRMANKDDYVAGLLYLISDASKYMTGANLVIDGGWTAW